MIVVALAIALSVGSLSASASTIVITDCPGAWYVDGSMIVNPYSATDRGDSDYSDMHSASYDQWVKTGAYSSTPWSGSLPPSNATIQWVYMCAFLYQPSGPTDRTFTLAYATDGMFTPTWEHETAKTTVHGTDYWGNPYSLGWMMYSVNITSFETWTPASVTSDYIAVKMASTDHNNIVLYVDYVGIRYGWNYSEPAAGEGYTFDTGALSITGTMGMVGFIGMVAIPGAAVWFYRRDGGSKLYAGVMALVAFVFCLGLFLASIGA